MGQLIEIVFITVSRCDVVGNSFIGGARTTDALKPYIVDNIMLCLWCDTHMLV